VGTFRHLGDRKIYDGYIWKVVVGDFVAPNGEAFTRDIVRSPGAVAVVPIRYNDAGEPLVVLVKQYRAAFDRIIIEVPAGMRDIAGEAPEVTAVRELAEETGYTATNLELLHQFYPSTGMTDSVLHVYLATGLAHVGQETHGPEEDHMEVFEIPFAEAVSMVVSGEIADAKSTIGLLLADRRLRGLDSVVK
jgi:ADP-ribose pyrophosphatase